jgi:hypothetical protein
MVLSLFFLYEDRINPRKKMFDGICGTFSERTLTRFYDRELTRFFHRVCKRFSDRALPRDFLIGCVGIFLIELSRNFLIAKSEKL